MSQEIAIDEIKPTGLPARVRDAAVGPGEIALWHLGGAGYAVRTADSTIIIDPFLGPSSPPDWIRGVPPPFAPEEIADFGVIHLLMITHEHTDHADPVALAAFVPFETIPIAGPAPSIEVARLAGIPEGRLHVVDHGDVTTFGDLTITAVAVHDPTAQACNGYVLHVDGLTVLLCADSHYFDGFAALGQQWKPDVVVVTAGLNPPGVTLYMGESDAGRIARDTGAALLIHQHHDLWELARLDPARVAEVVAWYAPACRVEGTVWGERISLQASQFS